MENMARKDAVISVCKRCGAVGGIKQPHCVFCGAALTGDMQVCVGRYRGVPESKRNEKPAKKKITATSFLALVLGILAVVMLAVRIFDCGFLFGILTLILAIVALCQRKGGGILSAVSVGLGVYTLFVNLFWFFYNFFMIF